MFHDATEVFANGDVPGGYPSISDIHKSIQFRRFQRCRVNNWPTDLFPPDPPTKNNNWEAIKVHEITCTSKTMGHQNHWNISNDSQEPQAQANLKFHPNSSPWSWCGKTPQSAWPPGTFQVRGSSGPPKEGSQVSSRKQVNKLWQEIYDSYSPTKNVQCPHLITKWCQAKAGRQALLGTNI